MLHIPLRHPLWMLPGRGQASPLHFTCMHYVQYSKPAPHGQVANPQRFYQQPGVGLALIHQAVGKNVGARLALALSAFESCAATSFRVRYNKPISLSNRPDSTYTLKDGELISAIAIEGEQCNATCR